MDLVTWLGINNKVMKVWLVLLKLSLLKSDFVTIGTLAWLEPIARKKNIRGNGYSEKEQKSNPKRTKPSTK
nr:hypothetical protein [Tanacetum cinerariifolium]